MQTFKKTHFVSLLSLRIPHLFSFFFVVCSNTLTCLFTPCFPHWDIKSARVRIFVCLVYCCILSTVLLFWHILDFPLLFYPLSYWWTFTLCLVFHHQQVILSWTILGHRFVFFYWVVLFPLDLKKFLNGGGGKFKYDILEEHL
jgi:hypothetical protein